uniref:Leucine-rich repeat domain-containing protein n=1 Tax=Panagrellus redivivus TaxID=6233 RepID=A0A7E4UP08_PANRE
MVTKCTIKSVFLLLVFILFDLTEAINPTPQTTAFRNALKGANLRCKVTQHNVQLIDVVCDLLSHELDKLFRMIQRNNIHELKVKKNRYGRKRINLYPLPPFYCEIIKLESFQIVEISDYAFVNVEGLTELYLEHLRLTQLPLFGYLPDLEVLSLSGNPLTHLTNHFDLQHLEPMLSSPRIFTGVELLERIDLYNTDVKITAYDMVDLPRLIKIAPPIAAPRGFVLDYGFRSKADQAFINDLRERAKRQY